MTGSWLPAAKVVTACNLTLDHMVALWVSRLKMVEGLRPKSWFMRKFWWTTLRGDTILEERKIESDLRYLLDAPMSNEAYARVAEVQSLASQTAGVINGAQMFVEVDDFVLIQHAWRSIS